MKFLRLTVLVFLCLPILIACNNSSGINKERTKDVSSLAVSEEQNKFVPQNDQIADTAKRGPQKMPLPQSEAKISPQSNIDWDKKIIKTASINLEVKDYKSFNELLDASIKKYGAYIAQEEQNQSDYKIENSISIKVPVEQFDDLVNVLTTGEQKLIEKKISSEDVTTEVVDTKSRTEAKKQVRLKYLDLLKQAKNMEEILNLQNEINGIQEEIEAATGRVEYLSHSAAYSTINLTYSQILDAAAKDEGETSYGTKAWQSFRNGWLWISDVIIGMISIWPLFLFGFACWFAVKKWLNPKIQKKNA